MRIKLAPDIEPRFHAALRQAGKREVGGMLFAEQLAPSDFCIVDFSLDAQSGSRVAFRRDQQTHKRMLDAFFERTGSDFPRFNYLGEWHTHPSFPVHPSLEDVGSMQAIVTNPRTAITFAVLLILRLRWRLWIDHSLTLFARDQAPHSMKLSRRVTWI